MRITCILLTANYALLRRAKIYSPTRQKSHESSSEQPWREVACSTEPLHCCTVRSHGEPNWRPYGSRNNRKVSFVRFRWTFIQRFLRTFLLLTPKDAIVNEFPVTVSEGYIGVKNNTFGYTIILTSDTCFR